MDMNTNDNGVFGGSNKLFTKKEAAAELGVTYRTIERLRFARSASGGE